jgi:hypothetical protein
MTMREAVTDSTLDEKPTATVAVCFPRTVTGANP